MKLKYIVQNIDDNKLVKDILIKNLNISHSLLITLKKNNCIFLNGINAFVFSSVHENDELIVSLDYEEDNSNIIPTKMDLNIVFEDDCYLIIDKPASISVHPSITHYSDSLSNGVRNYFDEIGLKKKIRPVNRIDKDTSGLVIFAKNEYIQECLIKQMNCNKFLKEYIAIVEGKFDIKKGLINAPIGRKENSIIERCIVEDGKPSITHYEVLFEKQIQDFYYSIIKCTLETGRTHQIRVHMSYINHPLLGDDLYGGNTNFIKRQALHSCKISFYHPINNNLVTYESCIPNDLLSFFNKNTIST